MKRILVVLGSVLIAAGLYAQDLSKLFQELNPTVVVINVMESVSAGVGDR